MGRGFSLVCALLLSCGGDSGQESSSAEAPTPEGPTLDRKTDPAPRTEVAYARAVVESLREREWESYTNLLATRADMMGIYAQSDRHSDRKRRQRRRMVWRRVNKLRNGGAKKGWRQVRRTLREEEIAWDAIRLRDVRRIPVEDERLPSKANAITLMLEFELEIDGSTRWLDLGICVQAKRGWVALHPMSWSSWPPASGTGESLLGAQK